LAGIAAGYYLEKQRLKLLAAKSDIDNPLAQINQTIKQPEKHYSSPFFLVRFI